MRLLCVDTYDAYDRDLGKALGSRCRSNACKTAAGVLQTAANFIQAELEV